MESYYFLDDIFGKGIHYKNEVKCSCRNTFSLVKFNMYRYIKATRKLLLIIFNIYIATKILVGVLKNKNYYPNKFLFNKMHIIFIFLLQKW